MFLYSTAFSNWLQSLCHYTVQSSESLPQIVEPLKWKKEMLVMSRQCSEIWTSSRARNPRKCLHYNFPKLHHNKLLNSYHVVSLCGMCQQMYESWAPYCFTVLLYLTYVVSSHSLCLGIFCQFVMCELHIIRIWMILFPASAVIWVAFICGS